MAWLEASVAWLKAFLAWLEASDTWLEACQTQPEGGRTDGRMEKITLIAQDKRSLQGRCPRNCLDKG